MSKQLIVTLFTDGSIEAETRGIFGEACLDYIGVLEDMLEADTTDSAFTADYSVSEHAVQQHTQLHSSEELWSGA